MKSFDAGIADCNTCALLELDSGYGGNGIDAGAIDDAVVQGYQSSQEAQRILGNGVFGFKWKPSSTVPIGSANPQHFEIGHVQIQNRTEEKCYELTSLVVVIAAFKQGWVDAFLYSCQRLPLFRISHNCC